MTSLVRLALCASLIACGGGDGNNNGGPDASDGVARGLDACADLDLDLGEMWTVNNLHGRVTSMAMATNGIVVLATVDGSVKQWNIGTTVDAAPLPGGRPSYGTPFVDTGDMVTALGAISDDDVLITGDTNGMFRRWSLASVQQVGADAFATSAYSTIAVTADAATVAIADVAFAGNVKLFPLAGSPSDAPLVTGLWSVSDLSFEADGDLLMAGEDYGMAAIERRAASDSAIADAWDDLSTEGAILAIDHNASHIAAAGARYVAILDATDLAAGPIDFLALATGERAVSTALSASGDYVAVAIDSGEENGRVVIFERDGLAEVSSFVVPTPVAIGLDPSGDRLVVASTDGRLRALTCQ